MNLPAVLNTKDFRNVRQFHITFSDVHSNSINLAVHFETKSTKCDTPEADLAIAKDVYIVKIPLISRDDGHSGNNSKKVAA